MKKIVFFLFVALGWLQANANGPILAYGHHPLSEVRTRLIMGKSDTAREFRSKLIPYMNEELRKAGESLVITESNIGSYITNKTTFSEERILEANTFSNSGWNPALRRIDVNLSSVKFEGFVNVFRYGRANIVLWKDNCCNLLIVASVAPPPPTVTRVIVAERKEPEIAFVVLPQQQQSCVCPVVARQGSNTTIVANIMINAMGGGRYNYSSPYVVSPTRQWFPQSGGPVGVPGFPAYNGGPSPVNGFPANTSGGPVDPYGFNAGGPVGINGFPATQSNWGP